MRGRDCQVVAHILVVCVIKLVRAARTLVEDHLALRVGLVGEGFVGPVVAVTVAQVIGCCAAAHADDEAVGDGEHGCQSC